VGTAFSLDGIDDHVRVPDSPTLRPASLTVEGWFSFSSLNSLQVLFAKTAGTGTHESFIVFYQNGMLQATIGDATSIEPPLSVPFTPAPGTFHHVAFTFDDAADMMSLYLDGVKVALASVARSIGYDNHPVTLGAEFESEALSFFFAGLIDEVAFYSRALSTSEIQSIFNAGSLGKCPPPGLSGDANADGSVNVGDIFYLINHLFANGPSPTGRGDANGDGTVTVGDVFYLINFLFAGGEAPR